MRKLAVVSFTRGVAQACKAGWGATRMARKGRSQPVTDPESRCNARMFAIGEHHRLESANCSHTAKSPTADVRWHCRPDASIFLNGKPLLSSRGKVKPERARKTKPSMQSARRGRIAMIAGAMAGRVDSDRCLRPRFALTLVNGASHGMGDTSSSSGTRGTSLRS